MSADLIDTSKEQSRLKEIDGSDVSLPRDDVDSVILQAKQTHL